MSHEARREQMEDNFNSRPDDFSRLALVPQKGVPFKRRLVRPDRVLAPHGEGVRPTPWTKPMQKERGSSMQIQRAVPPKEYRRNRLAKDEDAENPMFVYNRPGLQKITCRRRCPPLGRPT